MVDFDSEVTVSTPATDIVKILILQARANLFESIEAWKRDEAQNIDRGSEAVAKARLNTLFMELQGVLKRKMDEKDYESLKKDCNSGENLLKRTYELNEFIDEKLKITQIDTRKQYDRTRVEEENEEKGLG